MPPGRVKTEEVLFHDRIQFYMEQAYISDIHQCHHTKNDYVYVLGIRDGMFKTNLGSGNGLRG